MVDYADRMRYLVSEAGSQRAAAKKYGIPRTTLSRILRGEGGASKRTARKLNRQYRKTAPDSVKKREKAGLGSGVGLVNRSTALSLERSYRLQGKEVRVVAHGKYTRKIGNTRQEETIYGRGQGVIGAENALEESFGKLKEKYERWEASMEGTKVLYRVYTPAARVGFEGRQTKIEEFA